MDLEALAELEGLLPRSLVNAQVRTAPLASSLAGGRSLAPWLTATPGEALFEYAGIRMLIRVDEVIVDLDEDADADQVPPLLYGTAMRILLAQRGTFSLHATVVRIEDTVVALAGRSGAGKSTTATALCWRYGAQLLVDDVVPTRVADGQVMVQTFDRPVHLTVEAAKGLGIDIADPSIARPGPRGKVAVPAALFGQPTDRDEPVILDRLVVVSLADAGNGNPADHSLDVEVREVNGAERLRWIVRVSNEMGIAALGDRGAPYFAWATGVADALPMSNVVRPAVTDTVDAVCARVLAIADRRAPATVAAESADRSGDAHGRARHHRRQVALAGTDGDPVDRP